MTDYPDGESFQHQLADAEKLSRVQQQFTAELQQEAVSLLCDLIRFQSVAGSEHDTQRFLQDWLASKGFSPELVSPYPELAQDPNYAKHSNDQNRACNLTIELPHSGGGGRSLLLNSHTDVVPAEEVSQYSPKIENGKVIGRGACDAKGQVVTWIIAMLAVLRSGVSLNGRVVGAAVVEEEIGGNGTLDWIRQNQPLDLAIVGEPTQLAIHPANRGAIWFEIELEGVPTHMGRWWEGRSAFENMESLIADIRTWDARLVEESRNVPLFPSDPSPVHVNIGIVRAGDWPAKVPGFAVMEGGVSFLPNKNLQSIREEFTEVVAAWSERTGVKAAIRFEKLQNEAYGTPSDHPGVKLLEQAVTGVAGKAEVSGFLASCDARLLYHRAGMPTIVFGPGDLMIAHGRSESIPIEEMMTAARVLANFIVTWSG